MAWLRTTDSVSDEQDVPSDAYFAGFFDGEGMIGISKPESTSLYLLRCNVTNTNERVVCLFKEKYGGSVLFIGKRPKENHKPVWVWKADARVAERFLRSVLKYLVVKRDRAELALEFRGLFGGEYVVPRGLAPRTGECEAKRNRIIQAREELYHRMRSLNQRGLKPYESNKTRSFG